MPADVPAIRPDTIVAISSILNLDGTISNARHQAVLRALDPNHEPADLVNAREAADLLGVSSATFTQWKDDPRRPWPFSVVSLPGRNGATILRYDRNEILAYVAANRHPPSPPP